MANDAPLDPAALERLRQLGGERFLKEMIAIFLDFVPRKIAQALEGQRAHCLVDIEKGAHAIRSSAGNLGARKLERLATEIERLAKGHQPEPLPALLNELQMEFTRIRTTLEEHQQSLSNRPD
jgi:HPt (histidine-containing phosphotransfer) domain-containing protein